MSQRNFQNPRNQGDGPKGKSRKSASSAKIKSKAGSSVYVRSKDAKAKAAGKSKADKPVEAKTKDTQEQMRRRERAMVSMMKDLPEYKKWRRVWWVFMIIAFVSIIISWVPNALIQNGMLSEDFTEFASWLGGVGFIFAMAALIGAFYVDFRKIRKIQKSQEAKAHTLSKEERRKLDSAIEEAIEKDQKARAERKGKRPWNRKKTQARPEDDTDAK